MVPQRGVSHSQNDEDGEGGRSGKEGGLVAPGVDAGGRRVPGASMSPRGRPRKGRRASTDMRIIYK